MQEIILYTIHCPKCSQLEKRLNDKNIKYQKCTDINTMKQLGMTSAPYLKVDGTLMNFTEAWKWASQQEVK